MLNLKITTVIIEKDKEELDITYSNLKKIDELSIIGKTLSVNKGLAIISNYAPDLVFVNMNLPNLSGIEFVKILQNRNIFPEVVFLANNKQYAYQSLDVKPCDYLVKPISREIIVQMLIRLKTKLKKKELMRKMDIFTKKNAVNTKRIFKQKGGIVSIPLDEIVFCKAELTRTILALKCGEKIKLKSGISETIETINSENFIRIGRSYCINRQYIRKIDKRNNKCQLFYEGNNWEVSTSKSTIKQLEKLNVLPMY